jgi:rod shape determining protein RodA
MIFDRRLISQFDWILFILTLAIPSLGLIVLFSAGYDADAVHHNFHWVPEYLYSVPFLKQILFIIAGVVAIAFAVLIPLKTWHRYAYACYGIGIVLLVAVALFGTQAKGSQRWLRLGGFNLQPAELMKLGLILGLARFLSAHPPPRNGFGFKQLIIPFLMFLVPMALIIKQPDLGTALSVGGVGFILVFFTGINWKTLLIMILVGGALLVPAWSQMHDYQKNRILTLVNPDLDPKGSGYHIAQSKIAVGSGALFGKGFMKGTQTQLEFLPEHTTDFIFSVLAEEWGFVGCIFVILMYFLFLTRLVRTATRCKELFASLLIVGISGLIFFHTAVNIGMVVGLLPVVGIPLPLFSYGGSSVISTMFGIGIVLGVGMRRLQYLSGS